jgi:hypothetical protein
MWKEEGSTAGLLEPIAPQVWNVPWNVHSQAQPHAHSALHYLAPYGFKVAIANRRIVGLTDRTVTFTSPKPGSTRRRTTPLDALEVIHRFLPHVLPEGVMQVRHCGFLHASGALPPDTIRRMIVQAHPIDCQPPPLRPPAPFVAFGPTCGGPMRVILCLWTTRAWVDTS